jgi:hypothetical protein
MSHRWRDSARSTRGRAGQPYASRARARAWVPGMRLEPTAADRSTVRNRATDLRLWKEGNESNSAMAQRLRVRVRAIEEFFEQEERAKQEVTAIAIPAPPQPLAVECLPPATGPWVPRFAGAPPIPAEELARLAREFSDANALRDPEDRFQGPWQFVSYQLDTLRATGKELGSARFRLDSAETLLAQERQKAAQLDLDCRAWIAECDSRGIELKRLHQKYRVELSNQLFWRDMSWQRKLDAISVEHSKAEAVLKETRAALSAEQRRRVELEDVFLALCKEHDRRKVELVSAYRSLEEELTRTQTLLELVKRLQEVSSKVPRQ